MLDVGWSELILIGVVALIFVGPKDLPRMFHALGRFTAKARGMAREFQRAMDDAAKSSGLDDVRKDLSGVKAGLNAASNPAGYGINALEDAARKFEKWDPKTVLKPAVATAAPAAAATAAEAAVPPVVTVGGTEIGPETKALADKRASEVAAARAKAHELQAKAAQSASATFAARAKADAEAAAAKAAAAAAAAEPEAKPKRERKAKPAEAAPDVAAAEAAKPARKPPVRRKKSEA